MSTRDGVKKLRKIGDELNQCLQIIVSNAGNIKDDRNGPILEQCDAIEAAVERAARAVRKLAALLAKAEPPASQSLSSPRWWDTPKYMQNEPQVSAPPAPEASSTYFADQSGVHEFDGTETKLAYPARDKNMPSIVGECLIWASLAGFWGFDKKSDD